MPHARLPLCPFCHYSGTTKDKLPYYDDLNLSHIADDDPAPGHVITCGNCLASGPLSPSQEVALDEWTLVSNLTLGTVHA